jgi:hypothetical protein
MAREIGMCRRCVLDCVCEVCIATNTELLKNTVINKSENLRINALNTSPFGDIR